MKTHLSCYDLPLPDLASQQISNQLNAKIFEEIARNGPMTFARYMELALYAPEYGYYRGGLKKFGEEGDFITAPELSPLFSQCLARQCQEILENMGGGDILEFGAGSGVMARTILQSLANRDALPNHYYILELSAELRQRQQIHFQQHAPELLSKVMWLDQWPTQPIKGIFLGNEVIDAMPVHRFGYLQQLLEYYVVVDRQNLVWRLGPLSSSQLRRQIEQLDIEFADGYTSEINLLLNPWVFSAGESLSQGVILLTDYGLTRSEYYHPDRGCGTIVCHYRHRAHSDPFWWPGLQDITTQVDFTAIAHAAVAAEFNVAGFTHQAGFLLNCGVTDFLAVSDPEVRVNLVRQVQRLTMPAEMGEPFKAMALTKNYEGPLMGFRYMSQLERL